MRRPRLLPAPLRPSPRRLPEYGDNHPTMPTTPRQRGWLADGVRPAAMTDHLATRPVQARKMCLHRPHWVAWAEPTRSLVRALLVPCWLRSARRPRPGRRSRVVLRMSAPRAQSVCAALPIVSHTSMSSTRSCAPTWTWGPYRNIRPVAPDSNHILSRSAILECDPMRKVWSM